MFLEINEIGFNNKICPLGYNRPSSGGFSSGGISSGGYSGGFGGGYNSNEGAQVDPQLLEQVRQILLREESQSSASAPSSSYGVPSSSYGVPSHGGGRVVAIQLENTIPSIQVASFSQQSYAPSAPSGSYGAPSQSYAAPSQSYGAPSQSYSGPSQSYSGPSFSAPSSSYSGTAKPKSILFQIKI